MAYGQKTHRPFALPAILYGLIAERGLKAEWRFRELARGYALNPVARAIAYLHHIVAYALLSLNGLQRCLARE